MAFQPPTQADEGVCERSLARKRGDLAQSTQDTGVPLQSIYSLCVCVCLFELMGSQTDRHVTYPEHPPDSQCPAASTGCVTHTFHFPLDVSGRPARQLIVAHILQKDGVLCWFNPDCSPSP